MREFLRQETGSFLRRALAVIATAIILVGATGGCTHGKSNWFGPTQAPKCDLAALPDPPDVPPVMPGVDPDGGGYSVMEISLQTRVLDGQDHCNEGDQAPVLGGLWDIGYNITSDGLPFFGTGPNPFNGTVRDPHVWIFRVHHGKPNQVPPLVSVDFHAKFSDGVAQKPLQPHGAGAALILRINGGPIRSSIAYPMVGGDFLRLQVTPAELAVYFP